MKMGWLVGVGLVASACASAPDPRLMPVMPGSDGNLWIPLKCESHLQCLTRAAFFCPGGYRVEGAEAHETYSVSGAVVRGTGSLHGQSGHDETMLVQCNSCEFDRAFRVDDYGHFSHDPNRESRATLCPGTASR